MSGMPEVATSASHADGNGGVEYVNHVVAQMLAIIVNDRQDDWDDHVPHAEFAYNNSISAASALPPNDVHMDRLSHLPLTVFEHPYDRGHQGLARDQLQYCDLAVDRQRRWFALVRDPHDVTIVGVER